MTTIFVSQVILDALPALKPHINTAINAIQPYVRSILEKDERAHEITEQYSDKAMGFMIYSIASMCYSKVMNKPISKEEERVVVGASLISLSSSLFDDAIDGVLDRIERSYLVGIADTCRLKGMLEIQRANVAPEIKNRVLDVIEKFHNLSWRSNLNDQCFKSQPTLEACENALDVIGFPVEAGARIGLAIAGVKDEVLARTGRLLGQVVALIDGFTDIELDLYQGFTARYPLYFALKYNPGIMEFVKNKKHKEAFAAIVRTDAVNDCMNLLKQKVDELNSSGLLKVHTDKELLTTFFEYPGLRSNPQ